MSDEEDRRVDELEKSHAFTVDDWTGYDRVVKRLAAKQDWGALEQATRKMGGLVAMHDGDVCGRPRESMLLEIWRSLRSIVQDRFGDLDAAATAAGEVVRLVPRDVAEQLTLASLCVATGQTDRALDAYEAALAENPSHAVAKQELFALHRANGALDAAWCVSAVREFHDELALADRPFYERRRATVLPSRTGVLDRDAWALLAHPVSMSCSLPSPLRWPS